MGKGLDDIVTKIRASEESRSKVIKLLYYDEQLRASIRKYIFNKGGNNEDSDEIFHSTLIQFVKTVTNKKDFEIKSGLNQYLFGIAKNLWFQRLTQKTKNRTEDLDSIKLEKETHETPFKILMNEEKKELIAQVLGKTGEKCAKVLSLWSNGYNMKEIAARLEYKSEMMARKKKCLCLKQLVLFLEKHPEIVKQLK